MAPFDFSRKLDIVLKALVLSRGRLAAELGVAKPMVSRWVSGVNAPADHNLLALTELIAERWQGFTLLDWDRAYEDFAVRLGMDIRQTAAPTPATAHPATGVGFMPPLPFGLSETAHRETERRGGAYTGRWRMTRLVGSGRMAFIVEHVVIRQTPAGVCVQHYSLSDHHMAGWLLVLNYRLYVVLADKTDDSLAMLLLNGVLGARAERMDGLMTTLGFDRASVPYSTIVVLDRVGDAEDEAADRAWATAPGAVIGIVPPEGVEPDVRAALSHDFGPKAFEAGGHATVRIPPERSLARGTMERLSGLESPA